MRQLPDGYLSDPCFAFLTYRRPNPTCSHRSYHPFGRDRGGTTPTGIISTTLYPHIYDANVSYLIDLCVKPEVKAGADPGLWHLILSPYTAAPKVPRCCFPLVRIPLIRCLPRGPLVIGLAMDGHAILYNVGVGLDHKRRLRSQWVFFRRTVRAARSMN